MGIQRRLNGSAPAPWLSLLLLLAAGCNGDRLTSPSPGIQPDAVTSSPQLASYFPPPETTGGWRTATSSAAARALGIDSSALAALGAYEMALPWENHYTGVSGYDASNKASLVIKNGWIVGEYYNQPSARTAVYDLASNSKTFTIMLMGKLIEQHPELGITLNTLFYDPRWLPEGFPLSDSMKAEITLDEVFRHTSGIIPQVEAPIANGAVRSESGWELVPFTVGKDTEWPQSAPLYFKPGEPQTYAKGNTYSSVAFNHFGLIFRNVTGLAADVYLRRTMLDPIGVGRVAFIHPSGMGDIRWATAGNALAGARDYARLMYLLLHEGEWNGIRIFPAKWIRQFTKVPGYPNISSNADCVWGAQYPKDMYRMTGSGVNIAFVVPSLDLVATLNGRTKSSLNAEVTAAFLTKLFTAITQPYTSCDGRNVNGSTGPDRRHRMS